jgi:cytosine/adenosine deaminase-related metal-dependent hydrolase
MSRPPLELRHYLQGAVGFLTVDYRSALLDRATGDMSAALGQIRTPGAIREGFDFDLVLAAFVIADIPQAAIVLNG